MSTTVHAAAATPPPHILVFPFPASGHMIPLLDLAHHLSLHGLTITILVTPKTLPLLSRSSPPPSAAGEIRPLVLPLPPSPSLPPGVESVHGGGHLIPMMHALAGLHHPILRWARSAESPPDLIISDIFLGWTHQLAADLGIPRVVFSPSGAFSLSVIHRLWRDMPRGGDDPDSRVPFPEIPGSPVFPWNQISPMYRRYRESDPLSEFVRQGFLDNISGWGFVFNSFAGLEDKYLEKQIAELGHRRIWAVGPLAPPGGSAAAGDRGGRSSVPVSEVLGWLDSCPEGSVVYVCFGSIAVLAPPQAAAVAAALERSQVRFVWIVRDDDSSVPEGFQDRTAGRGLVIRGWAPQVAILSHPAVGSFLTHCGWNSVLEGIVGGVAMLTWPMGADQFVNARLLVEEAGVATWACEGPDAVPDSDELARIILESVDGTRPERVRAVEMRTKAKEAVAEGGSSWRDSEALVEELWKVKLGNEDPVVLSGVVEL